MPRQKAWLITTRPCIPKARVRSMISSIENAPISPGSCRWISTPRPKRSARPKMVSRCPFGSRSMAQGSRPPTVSAPIRNACSSNASGAGPHQQAALRKRHQVDVDDVRQRRAGRQHALDPGHAAIGVDVDMAADEGAAVRHREHRLPRRLNTRIDRQRLADQALVVDAVDQARPDLVAIPGQAEQRLVEMRVRLDQAGQRDPAATVQHRDAVRCRTVGDAPGPDQNIARRGAERADIANQKIAHRHGAVMRVSQCRALLSGSCTTWATSVRMAHAIGC